MLSISASRNKSKVSKAFTVVEVGVIIPIVLVVVGAFILTIINFTTQAVESRRGNAIAVDTQNALNRLASDTTDSLNFLATNNFTPLSPQGVANNSAPFVNTSSRLILNTPLTKTSPRTANSAADNFVYKANSPLACTDSNVAQNSLATYNIVYFVSSSDELFRRVMVPANWNNSSYSCGGVVWQKPTCMAGQTGTYCSGGADEKISQDYTMSMALTYYDKELPIPATSTNTGTDLNRQTALDRATSVKVTLSASKIIDGETEVYTAERILPLN